ncbi:Methylmalonic aciduria and homocystinuria type D [Echinococcus granulosus]|uniref:Methylmalonic aciduria and homocystinuria type D n=1 Tax=Echinococcus granulosus TaxID=6210 RepID=W6URH1_ECHGR|nr:Methylmalonic aciduria and homocystinuria type D [Echinococcus granulosus]EUB63838.1 Methylmalonic aciduria and homocystinuria type D [Echinococcus granulosus]
MRCALRTGVSFCLKNFGRRFKTSNSLPSMTFRESFQPYIILWRKRLPPRRWPETQLGPIEAVNPRCPLPGHVGLLEISKETEISLIPATLILPPTSTNHYVSIMVQADFDAKTQSLVPDIDTSLIEYVVCACPQLIKPDLRTLFPSKNFLGARMTTIIFRYKMEIQTIENIEQVFEIFIQSAIDICALLRNFGYWADFIHPASGIPYLEFHAEPNISRLNRRLTPFFFVVGDDGCCKILRSRHFDGRLFIGVIFTDAPKNHPILTQFSTIER